MASDPIHLDFSFGLSFSHVGLLWLSMVECFIWLCSYVVGERVDGIAGDQVFNRLTTIKIPIMHLVFGSIR